MMQVAAEAGGGNCTRLVSVRLLDTTGRRGGFTGGLRRELLTRGFATGGFTCRSEMLVMMLSVVEVMVDV